MNISKRLTIETLKTHPKEAKAFIESLTEKELEMLKSDWTFWARDEQLPPTEWWSGERYIWILRCGRGWGKTRTACQTVIKAIMSGRYKRISICGATAEEVRDIMIEGESGLKACIPPMLKMDYRPSIKKIFFTGGVTVSLFYGSEPEKSRGAQSDFLWCDEIHKWQYPEETFDNLLLGLRLGDNPLCIVTSTPKPTAFTRPLESLKRRDGESACVVTVGSTYSNKANLSPTFFSTILSKYEGSRLALQELEGQILDDNPNALFKREWIERNKVRALPAPYFQERLIIAVDPAITHNKKTSDYTGIIVVMQASAPLPQDFIQPKAPDFQESMHYYILYDASLIGTPYEWGATVAYLASAYKANAIIVEDNQGGDMTEATLLNAKVSSPIYRVHSSQNKEARAMQASILCEQNRLHFLQQQKDDVIKDERLVQSLQEVQPHTMQHKNLDLLEDELVNWTPGDKKSPDRLDALAHAINFLNHDDSSLSKEEETARNIINSLF